MAYGIVEYDSIGNPKCEICGKHIRRVGGHVRMVHKIEMVDYKKQFGFDNKKGICSKDSSELSRERVFENYDKVVTDNLTRKGKTTRFVEGSAGRPKEKVREQTRLALAKRGTEIFSNLHKNKQC